MCSHLSATSGSTVAAQNTEPRIAERVITLGFCSQKQQASKDPLRVGLVNHTKPSCFVARKRSQWSESLFGSGIVFSHSRTVDRRPVETRNGNESAGLPLSSLISDRVPSLWIWIQRLLFGVRQLAAAFALGSHELRNGSLLPSALRGPNTARVDCRRRDAESPL